MAQFCNSQLPQLTIETVANLSILSLFSLDISSSPVTLNTSHVLIILNFMLFLMLPMDSRQFHLDGWTFCLLHHSSTCSGVLFSANGTHHHSSFSSAFSSTSKICLVSSHFSSSPLLPKPHFLLQQLLLWPSSWFPYSTIDHLYCSQLSFKNTNYSMSTPLMLTW